MQTLSAAVGVEDSCRPLFGRGGTDRGDFLASPVDPQMGRVVTAPGAIARRTMQLFSGRLLPAPSVGSAWLPAYRSWAVHARRHSLRRSAALR